MRRHDMGPIEKSTLDWYIGSATKGHTKEAKAGHWRKVDGRGEDQNGNPIRGKTWVDTKDSGITPGGLLAMGLLGAGATALLMAGRRADAGRVAGHTTSRPWGGGSSGGGGGFSGGGGGFSGGGGGFSGGGGGGGTGKRSGWPFNERPNPPKAPRPQQPWHDQQYADDVKSDDDFYGAHGRGSTEDEFWERINREHKTAWGPKARDAEAKARGQSRAEGKTWGDSHRQSQAWHDSRYRTEVKEDDAFYAKHGRGRGEKEFWESVNRNSGDPSWHAGPEARNRQAKQRADQGGRWDEQSGYSRKGPRGSDSSNSSSSGYGGKSSGGSSSSSDPWDAWRSRGSAAHESVLKSWGVDAANISKKKEIKAIFRGKAMDLHPDKHPGKEAEYTRKMQDLNTEWEKVEKSSWYEKLARLRQMRLRGR